MKTEQNISYENKVALRFLCGGLATGVVGLALAFAGVNGASTFLGVVAASCGLIGISIADL